MKEMVIAYSRHCELGDKYSEDYKYKARLIVDQVAEEIRSMKVTCITSIQAELREVIWTETGLTEPIFSLFVNEKYLFGFKIEEWFGIESKIIADRLNNIIFEKIKGKS